MKVRSSYNIPFLERKIQFFLELIDYRFHTKLYLNFLYIFPFLSVFKRPIFHWSLIARLVPSFDVLTDLHFVFPREFQWWHLLVSFIRGFADFSFSARNFTTFQHGECKYTSFYVWPIFTKSIRYLLPGSYLTIVFVPMHIKLS